MTFDLVWEDFRTEDFTGFEKVKLRLVTGNKSTFLKVLRVTTDDELMVRIVTGLTPKEKDVYVTACPIWSKRIPAVIMADSLATFCRNFEKCPTRLFLCTLSNKDFVVIEEMLNELGLKYSMSCLYDPSEYGFADPTYDYVMDNYESLSPSKKSFFAKIFE